MKNLNAILFFFLFSVAVFAEVTLVVEKQDGDAFRKKESPLSSFVKLKSLYDLSALLSRLYSSIGNDSLGNLYYRFNINVIKDGLELLEKDSNVSVEKMNAEYLYVRRLILDRIKSINELAQSSRVGNPSIVDSLITASELYSFWKDSTSALKYAQMAIDKADKISDCNSQIAAIWNIGELLNFYSNDDFSLKGDEYLITAMKKSMECQKKRRALLIFYDIVEKPSITVKQEYFGRRGSGNTNEYNASKTILCESAFSLFENEFKVSRDTLLYLSALNGIIDYYDNYGDFEKCSLYLSIAGKLSDRLREAKYDGLFSEFVKLDSGYVRRRMVADLVELEFQKKTQERLANSQRVISYISTIASILILIMFYFAFRNYRNQKQANRDLKDAQAQLIHQEKMASIGQLTSGIAHEIQNPLNFVNNFSELSLEYLEEIKEAKCDNISPELLSDFEKNLTMINHHGKRADGIVKGMLMHSRAGKSEMQPTSINALCSDFVNLCIHSFRAKYQGFECEIKLDLDQSLPLLKIVPQDIGRVILNLINNALYSVKEKGKQGIKEYKPEIKIKTSSASGLCKIEITDNGLGIPVDIKDKIFNPFFTTKPIGEGTGLGLSLSYEIAKAHKGNLTFSSEQDATRFILSLPMI